MNAPVAHTSLQPDFVQRPIPEEFLLALQTRFGGQCSTALAVREQHGRDEGAISAPPPAAVVFAESTQDVQDAVTLCDRYDVPVIAYGAGSSLEGHLLAVQGGITIDVSRMNRVLSVNTEDLTIIPSLTPRSRASARALRVRALISGLTSGVDKSAVSIMALEMGIRLRG